VVTWRDETLILTRSGGGAISGAEILASLIDAPHRQPFLDQIGGPGLFRGSGPGWRNGGRWPGMDRLFGQAGDDWLSGLGSEDDLFGNDGDDALDGGAGADKLDGGSGRDTATYGASDQGVTVRLWAGDGRGGHAEGDRLTRVEDLSGSLFDDTLVGDDAGNHLSGGAGADALWGNSGDDTLEGGPGADILNGQAGQDWASYAASASGVTVRLWSGEGFGGDAEGDTFSGIEALRGSDHADTLVGDANDNVLSGGPGADALWGNAGTTRSTAARGGPVAGAGRAGLGQLRAIGQRRHRAPLGRQTGRRPCPGRHACRDRTRGRLRFRRHAGRGRGRQHPERECGADALWGNDGDDTLEGGAGADLSGRTGRQRLGQLRRVAGRRHRAPLGRGRAGGDAAGDTLRGIENVIGSDHADTLVGNAADNHLIGGAGDDDIWANDGDDVLEGGAGSDILRGQGGSDTASYAASSEGITLRLWAGDGWGGDATGDVLIDIENAEGLRHLAIPFREAAGTTSCPA
jgi:Ca2+-binding RTX toxin-like protein